MHVAAILKMKGRNVVTTTADKSLLDVAKLLEQHDAAQSLTTKRKTGTVAKSQSGSKRSAKAKRKVGSVRRGKS